MKTENTLRTARNSLLCFFMALGAGFLVACGGGGGGGNNGGGNVTFPVYLSDAAVEGAEYSSGPASNGLTEKGGVFMADEGVFEFSIGATALGSVQISRDWDGSQVTPADFIGVDEEKVIDIARILQGLDEDGNPQNGILISQNTRENAPDLFGDIDGNDGTVAIVIGAKTFMIPSKDDATEHFVATRKCLFSGGYVGNFEGADLDEDGNLDEDGRERRGQSYYAVEPFASPPRVRRFTSGGNDDFESFVTSPVGVIGSVITLSPGNELSFITPRLVAGEWQFNDDDGNAFSSGTESLTHADTGNPGATRRIVGVETTGTGVTIAGMYVLDYFEEATVFRGRYYGVNATATIGAVSSVPLSLTIAGGGSWPAAAGMTTTLTLSGTLGEDDTTVIVEVVRNDENYGSFGGVGTQELSGTWCDIGGATGVAVPPPQTPPAPRASARSENEIEITWSAVSGATRYYLYRSTSSGEITLIGDGISTLRYRDSGLSENTEYFYRLEACNSVGCSEELSPEVSATTRATPPVAPTPPVALGQCREGLELDPGQNCTWIGHTISVSPGSGLSVISIAGPAQFTGPTSFTRHEGRPRTDEYQIFGFGSSPSGTLRAHNSGDDDTWTITRVTSR